MSTRRTLYPAIAAFAEGHIQRGVHSVHWEKSGCPTGTPVIVLHGGPGGSFQASYRQFFDPTAFCVLGFDQRGCGQSTPTACLDQNTTQDLIGDIEVLRKEHFPTGKKVVVFGGSWGSTLALAYAQAYPEHVSDLVLRGIFTLRRSELEWFYQLVDKDGQLTNCGNIFPEEAEAFIEPIPKDERHDLIAAYSQRLTGGDAQVQLACARAWSTWEMKTCRLLPDPSVVAKADDDKFALEFARIENHYFQNGGFFEADNQLIERANVLEQHGIRGTIVQGRYDVVCPARTAYELHKNWPSSELIIVADSGHSAKEDGIVHELVSACDKIAAQVFPPSPETSRTDTVGLETFV